MSIATFAEFLTTQTRPKFGFQQSKEPCVYYLCSLDNFHKIIKSGHILPKNKIHYSDTIGDLSASTIQSRREDDVNVGDGQTHQPTPGHNCLNFFLNPHNSTFQSFARNSMVDNSGDNQVLILEINLKDLAEFLKEKNHLFGCSARNIAKGAAVTSIRDAYARFSWDEIMATKGSSAARAAEFLLWMGDNTPSTPSDGLPTRLINKVYCEANLFEDLDDVGLCEVSIYNHTWSKSFLFNYATDFNRFLQQDGGLSCNEAFGVLAALVEEMPFSLSVNAFTDHDLALHYQHGYLHVVKVMFWVAFLTHPKIIDKVMPKEEQCEHLAEDSMLAALIHDLARTSNLEDEQHGKMAVRKYTDELLKHTGRNLPRVKRIRQAVQDHCKSDAGAKDSSSSVWKILKDADALDRGRFANPCDATDLSKRGCKTGGCRHMGCVHKTLRLDYDQLGGNRTIADAARNLALIVNSASLSPTEPVESFISYVSESIKVGS